VPEKSGKNPLFAANSATRGTDVMSIRRIMLPLACVALLLAGEAQLARADIILESTTLSQPGQFGGPTISAAIFRGARFHVDTAVEVDQVGGHLGGAVLVGGIFAAILSLDGPLGFPNGDPFSFTPLAVTTINPPVPSADLLVPLSVTLAPGDYALIFGSGRFGATGLSALPSNFGGQDTGQATYFEGQAGQWINSNTQLARFVVTGEPVVIPEPSALALLSLGAVVLAGYYQRRWRTA
jgi:hypothetical protein